MGTPQFAATVLEALLRSSCQVVAVYTQPDRPAGRGHRVVFAPVKRLGLERALPVMQPQNFRSSDVVDRLAGLGPELIVVAAFGLLLRPGLLSLPRFGCLNVHPSLLPRHRGPSPVPNTILCGDEVTGVTIMLMDAGLDTGPILAQEQVGVSSLDTSSSLGIKLAEVGGQLLLNALPAWLNGELTPQPQDDSHATYSRLIRPEDAELDWHLPAVELGRRVRAYNPWPVCYTWHRGQRLRIYEALASDPEAEGQIGEVIALSGPPGIGVVSGQGVLGLCRLQLEGRRDMSAGEFVRGQRDFLGSVLGTR
jgi:methionyl-tRNA formyltransferase